MITKILLLINIVLFIYTNIQVNRVLNIHRKEIYNLHRYVLDIFSILRVWNLEDKKEDNE